ncbi:hypothetical protein ACHAQA_003631 [Verticillium albo-atrum]
MPTTRRSTGGARARPGPDKGQSTISFSNKVSKAVPRQDLKKAAVTKGDRIASHTKKEREEVSEAIEIEVEPEIEQPETKIEAPEKSEAEVRAEKMTDAQINKYWKNIEAERIAKRVHVDDLTTGEKVLRYFDVSSQYGPCVGIQRKRRWERADKLGLNPPIEVLAVLLKEQKQGDQAERAHMDAILNSTAVGST